MLLYASELCSTKKVIYSGLLFHYRWSLVNLRTRRRERKREKIDWLRYFILHKAQIYLNIREKCFELHSQYNTIKIIIIINVDIMRADTHTLVACMYISKEEKAVHVVSSTLCNFFFLCVWLYREIILFLFFLLLFFSCFPASAR